MVIENIYFPTEDEIEQGIRFRTYMNYICSVDEYIQQRNVVNDLSSSNTFQTIQCGKCKDYGRLGQLLRNAWLTEIQLCIPAENEDILPYANHWIPVQSYYSIYLAIRAYFLASGQSVSNDHATSLRTIATEIYSRSELYPLPWKVLCVGNPDEPLPQLFSCPVGVSINQISNLTSTSKVPFWDYYSLLMKTTRARHLETLCNEWKKNNGKKRISPQAKKHCIEKLCPTSFFHFIYRLRLRSNYQDADPFLLTSADTDGAKDFYFAIKNVVWWSMFLFEALTAKYIGKHKYEEQVQSLNKYDCQNRAKGTVLNRWQIMQDSLL
jgi:hypothetical protein